LRLTDSGTIISRNYIEHNVAADHGGGIYAGWILSGVGFQTEISWNILIGNWAHGRAADFQGGGGIWLSETGAWVHHNTIVGNLSSDDAGGAGGGMALVDESSAVVEQNIIAYNPLGHGIACFNSTPTLRNNLAWSNWLENVDPVCVQFWSGNGNIVADPQFCDTTRGDFSLASSSPAMLHPAGPLGAIASPGCSGTPVQRTTWGTIKAKFHGQ
jgi:parallel beta helix pectate lyase-like protein